MPRPSRLAREGPPMTRRRLPAWVAGGPEVSTLAYQIVCEAFGEPPRPTRLDLEGARGATNRDVVAYLVDVLDADEADVLRAMAELDRAGVFVKDDTKARQR